MRGLTFQVQQPVGAVSPNRMDIACFVGLAAMRDDPPRGDIEQWLYERSWLDNDDEGFRATYHREAARELLDVPVPIESWERFTQLFAWDRREFADGIRGAGYLAAAVRSFFAQGGRRCYVVRVGAPRFLAAAAATRDELIARLIPGYRGSAASTPGDRDGWRGAGHILGLPDVTLLCLPDLPDLLRVEPGSVDTTSEPPPSAEERFVVCSETPLADGADADSAAARLPAPRCDLAGYRNWAGAINTLARLIADFRPDVQLVASLPLPDPDDRDVHNPLELMHREAWLSGTLDSGERIVASAFVQLCYPWVRTAGADLLPQRLEPPDGSLAGMLARNAISRGAYRSLNGIRQSDIGDLHPRLGQAEMYAAHRESDDDAPEPALIDRVSLFGFTADGVGVLSDVTSSERVAHRPANVNRIISMVRRAAQKAGEEYLFESNGERLWAALSQRLNDVLRLLYDLGALRGKQPGDAYYVRCDRSTMSQQDLDQGRIVALVQFEPAASIESIEVVLSMQQNGTVSLATIGIEQEVA